LRFFQPTLSHIGGALEFIAAGFIAPASIAAVYTVVQPYVVGSRSVSVLLEWELLPLVPTTGNAADIIPTRPATKSVVEPGARHPPQRPSRADGSAGRVIEASRLEA